MTIVLFSLGTIVFFSYALTNYWDALKDTSYFYAVGLSLALAGNLIWLMIVQRATSNNAIVYYAAAWDTMILLAFIMAPFILQKITLSFLFWLGLSVTLVGLFFLKLSLIQAS